jgi:hypothetical protein
LTDDLDTKPSLSKNSVLMLLYYKFARSHHCTHLSVTATQTLDIAQLALPTADVSVKHFVFVTRFEALPGVDTKKPDARPTLILAGTPAAFRLVAATGTVWKIRTHM